MDPFRRRLLFGSSLDADALAWSKVVTVSFTRLQLVSQTISRLKSDGIWPLLDRLWIHAAENSLQGRTCLKSLSVSTPVNGPTFTANRGVTGDGVSSYVDTNFTPSTAGGSFALNAASLGAYIVTARSAGQNSAIMGSTGTQSRLFPKYGDNNTYYTVNTLSQDSVAGPASIDGFWSLNRSGAGALALFKDGVSFATSTMASTGLTNNSIFVCGVSNGVSLGSPSTDQIAAYFLGGSIAGKEAAFRGIIRTHLTAIGVP